MEHSAGKPCIYDRWFVTYSITTFLTSLTIFRWISPRLSARFVPSYSTLPRNIRVDWDSTLVSLCFAVTVSCSASYGFIFEDGLLKDPVWGYSQSIPLVYGLMLGYMAADVVMKFMEYAVLCETVYVVHHVVAIICIFAVAYTGASAFFYYVHIISEVSQIFLCFNKFFRFTQMSKRSLLVLANNIMFAIVFFVSRIAILPWYYIIFFRSFWTVTVQPPVHYILGWWVGGLVIDIMNIYWFFLIVRKGIKIFYGEKEYGNTEVKDTESGKDKRVD